jgi:hypothetical protein
MKMMLIHQGKKMTLPLSVKKPFGIDACLLNEPASRDVLPV